eukprot:CAMPEP_0205881802 /NCGR_PEP_ID=MMETSP1083-20121108/16664_1 /ASSEMBLY_ACC=CAM_ASM_000430 /TAXON_ID=97485 /ORGANISM="Prymnesium parvum, Strain Texoma1" /LENGTH=129 /DNA_ID=CAMNT_0053244931 /DNA_START=73 /DNA_END=460 /DNA_ORIENTATION=-
MCVALAGLAESLLQTRSRQGNQPLRSYRAVRMEPIATRVYGAPRSAGAGEASDLSVGRIVEVLPAASDAASEPADDAREEREEQHDAEEPDGVGRQRRQPAARRIDRTAPRLAHLRRALLHALGGARGV